MVSVMLVKTMEKGNIEKKKKNAALKNFQDLKTSSRSETGLYSLGEKKNCPITSTLFHTVLCFCIFMVV